jgi:hypothetical protein
VVNRHGRASIDLIASDGIRDSRASIAGLYPDAAATMADQIALHGAARAVATEVGR